MLLDGSCDATYYGSSSSATGTTAARSRTTRPSSRRRSSTQRARHKAIDYIEDHKPGAHRRAGPRRPGVGRVPPVRRTWSSTSSSSAAVTSRLGHARRVLPATSRSRSAGSSCCDDGASRSSRSSRSSVSVTVTVAIELRDHPLPRAGRRRCMPAARRGRARRARCSDPPRTRRADEPDPIAPVPGRGRCRMTTTIVERPRRTTGPTPPARSTANRLDVGRHRFAWWLGGMTLPVSSCGSRTCSGGDPPPTATGYHGYRLGGDAFYYHWQANALAKGAWFVDPVRWFLDGSNCPSAGHPPLYAVYLALWSSLGPRHASPAPARLVAFLGIARSRGDRARSARRIGGNAVGHRRRRDRRGVPRDVDQRRHGAVRDHGDPHDRGRALPRRTAFCAEAHHAQRRGAHGPGVRADRARAAPSSRCCSRWW